MHPANASLLITFISLTLYPSLGILLLRCGWLVRAALAMAAAALLPIFYQAALTDSDAPGFAILAVPMLVPPTALLVAGALWWAWRWTRRRCSADRGI